MLKSLTEHDSRTHSIIGAAIEVHRQLGYGFLEPVYQESLALEFTERAIPFRREEKFSIEYKGQRLSIEYRPDFVCFDAVIVEHKALARTTGKEESQVINYLKATGFEVGLLLNFGTRSLDHHRFVFTKPANRI